MAEAVVRLVRGSDESYQVQLSITSGMTREEMEKIQRGLEALTSTLYKLQRIKAKEENDTGEINF